jgi:NADPH:quinone reductase-like Zn-dependent oxidoreductase
MAETMQRWTIDGPRTRSLQLETVSIPEPGQDRVFAQVHAVSLIYRDKLMIKNGMDCHSPSRLFQVRPWPG